VLLARGLNDVLAAREPAPLASAPRVAAAVWPGDEARAFAVRFARAYLGFAPGGGSARASELQAFVSPELATAIVPIEAGRGRPPEVRDVVVEHAARVDDRQALVTVAATVAGSSAPRLLTVPVARDASGGLVVSDLPAFAAPPPRAAVSVPELDPLPAADRAAIEDVLERFLRPFLAGHGDELAYLVPPGTRIEAVAAPLELVEIDDVTALAGGTSEARWVLASVRASDRASGVSYGLRYRVRVVRGERWLVAAVESSPKGG
jgi:Conjugative transposon protein TcpC